MGGRGGRFAVEQKYVYGHDPKTGVVIAALKVTEKSAALVFAATPKRGATFSAFGPASFEARTSRGRVRWAPEGLSISIGRKTRSYPLGEKAGRELGRLAFRDRSFQRNIMTLILGAAAAEKGIHHRTGIKIGIGGVSTTLAGFKPLAGVVVCTLEDVTSCVTSTLDEFSTCMSQMYANWAACTDRCARKHWWQKPGCYLACYLSFVIDSVACVLKGIVSVTVCTSESAVVCEVQGLMKLATDVLTLAGTTTGTVAVPR